ncbi:hypothetical protein [Pedobacter insulae]|uniref:TerB family tellurite resistance protein n=1 Tax=Pedobacter insulae TaxID=414048 RepID=A0A1I2ZJE8_9SPHI|nr:hypothetical protein [Pedobacter insulae]SFH37928.1 hypothetical protein SAMN04489864_11075 [Pedobacter insulae]
MKRVITILCMLAGLLSTYAKAQTPDEWINQKATQKKYLLEQIAALQVQIGYIQKGYKIAKDGLDFISKAAKGEFDLHNAFFISLKNVNPLVRKYPQVAGITGLQAAMLKSQATFKKQLDESGNLTAEETTYVNQVFERIQKDCDQVLDELKTVTTSNKLEMKDDERIARINALYKRMQQNYLTTESFGNVAIRLAISRRNEKKAIENSRILNGLKK